MSKAWRFVWITVLWFLSQTMNFLFPAVLRFYGYDPEEIADKFIGRLIDPAAPITISTIQVALFFLITIALIFVLAWPYRNTELRLSRNICYWFRLSMPLNEAARMIYENMEGELAAIALKILSEKAGRSLLDHYAGLIVEAGVPLFGNEPPSKISRGIDKSNFGAAPKDFMVEGNTIICAHPRSATFANVRVRKKDIKKAEAAIRIKQGASHA